VSDTVNALAKMLPPKSAVNDVEEVPGPGFHPTIAMGILTRETSLGRARDLDEGK